jgi:hypothetical protein
LGADGEADALYRRWGDFREQVSAYARSVDASRIVVPPPRGGGKRLLYQAVRALPSSVTPPMAEEVDPVEAILREVRGGGVDLVAVGARREMWWARWLRRSVPVRVVERAPCSVLVVSISESGAAGYEPLAWV